MFPTPLGKGEEGVTTLQTPQRTFLTYCDGVVFPLGPAATCQQAKI